jgi:hypothetical protein
MAGPSVSRSLTACAFNIWGSPLVIARDKIEYFLNITMFPHHRYEETSIDKYMQRPLLELLAMAIAAEIVGNVSV